MIPNPSNSLTLSHTMARIDYIEHRLVNMKSVYLPAIAIDSQGYVLNPYCSTV